MVELPVGLSARPSIAWLRKTAKEHLAELRVADPAARLADAQSVAGIDALDAARVQVGRDAETYYPRRSLGRRQLDRTLELLLAAARPSKTHGELR
jgi:hypothetical protein